MYVYIYMNIVVVFLLCLIQDRHKTTASYT